MQLKVFGRRKHIRALKGTVPATSVEGELVVEPGVTIRVELVRIDITPSKGTNIWTYVVENMTSLSLVSDMIINLKMIVAFGLTSILPCLGWATPASMQRMYEDPLYHILGPLGMLETCILGLGRMRTQCQCN